MKRIAVYRLQHAVFSRRMRNAEPVLPTTGASSGGI